MRNSVYQWSMRSDDEILAVWRRDREHRMFYRLQHPRATRAGAWVNYRPRPRNGRETNGIPERAMDRFADLQRKILADRRIINGIDDLQYIGKWRENVDTLNAALLGKGKRRRRAVLRLWRMKDSAVRGGLGWMQ